ncbi:anti-sigma factor antagonist [candidate division KSB1 bacterium]|nr:STAS domain-containing protein [candidate division KSB1 bacterium]RQW02028.1 MAG: anti-sigma factor antagonist [candidate division KSB1 bacterium]
MAISYDEKNGVIVLHVKDKLIGGVECVEVKNRVQELLNRGYRDMVIDFSKLQWSNSAGIGALISCYHNFQQQGGRLKFARPSPKIQFYLHISKLDTIFEIYDTVEAAVASFGSR